MVRILNKTNYDCDVLIVGAGPGGSALATYLSKENIKVLLIDSQSFPRDKVCGDFVGPVALAELQKLGITGLEQYPETNVINKASLYLDGDKIINHPIPRVEGIPFYGRVIPRIVLDEWIFRKAVECKTTVWENTRLKNYEINGTGVKAEISQKGKSRIINAKLIIGADGSSSTVARIHHGTKPAANDKILAVRAYYENINGPDDQCDLFFTQDSFPGYYWLFPTGNGKANIGVGMVLETLPKNETHLNELLTSLIAKDKGLSARIGNGKAIGKIVGWPLSTYNPKNKIIGNRLLLLGDAAGLINSLNGEGIQYALLSARWAANTIKECAKQDDFSTAALTPYNNTIGEELRYDLALSNMIIQFIRNRTLNPLWMELLRILVARAKIDKEYAAIAGGILAGMQPANKALNPKFIIKTILQGMIYVGMNSASGIVKGPAHWLSLVGKSSKYLMELSKDIQSHPKGYADWITGIASNGIEISSHILKDVKNQVFKPS
ncbi:MAG: geranylgeranyl reductase family protein [Marinirhabdus sp.]